MGCIARLGCLVLLALLAAGAWLTRDKWMSKVGGGSPTKAVSSAPLWEPLSPAAAERGRRAINGLNSTGGPVFANLRAAEVASYVFQSASSTIPASADSAEAAVIGDALHVRAIIPVKALAGSGALGPLGGLLNDRERLSFAGSFRVIRPGLSEFQVREIKLRDFKVPQGAIPRLVKQFSRGDRPEGMSPEGILVSTPKTLGDVRIANHAVTLYKTTAPAP
ncbi:MAG: hypothetical protein H0W68_12435 [Gemmatimonadaceae bacterium]|nr:hypothetical protein [Gemmatimonadaceae bacterium]